LATDTNNLTLNLVALAAARQVFCCVYSCVLANVCTRACVCMCVLLCCVCVGYRH